MAKQLEVRVRGIKAGFPAELVEVGAGARASFNAAQASPGVHLLLVGERDYHVQLTSPEPQARAQLEAVVGTRVVLHFAGRSSAVRRNLVAVGGVTAGAAPVPFVPEAPAVAIDLTTGIFGAAPLFLLPEGALSASASGPAPLGMDALATMVAAARWVSTRRTTTFECLFPASPFHPEEPVRNVGLSPVQAVGLLGQLDAVLDAAAPGVAEVDAIDAAQLRSAVLTVLSHLLATVIKDRSMRAAADAAAERIFGLIAAEEGPGGRAELRVHAIMLLAMRGPALRPADQQRAQAQLRGLRRAAPPYAELVGPWRFAMNSGSEFAPGEIKLLQTKYRFTKIETPSDAPASPNSWGGGYTVLKAPVRGPQGQEILVFARSASPRDENHEMGQEYFSGVLISRHANLGAFDMRAALVAVEQRGYKLMMNAQCAGLTTRFAISRMFPDADIYSSWDSTYFSTGVDGEIVASEGVDCFVAVLHGMAAGEDFRAIDQRIRKAQWRHPQSRTPEFVQFIGPGNPLVVSRYEDINRDGKADFYDGGAAARGLNWAAGSLNRVAQYSELWDSLPGEAENFYAFRAAGFYSVTDPPRDVPNGEGPPSDPGTAPAVVRYSLGDGALSAEVLMHAWLSHSAQELKRLLVAADAYWRALDLGHLKGAPLDTLGGQRAGLLLLLAGLLEFPADPNMLDGLWESALDLLRLPRLSRSLVRRCIDDADHDRGNYYGSVRGVKALIGEGDRPGAIHATSPVAHDEIVGVDPMVGRLRPLQLPPPVSTPPVSTPPVSTPPVSTPPMSTPPVSTPPVSTPPL